MKKVLLLALAALLLTAGMAAAADDSSWLTIGGDYRFRGDSLRGMVHDYLQLIPGTTGPGTVVPISEHSVKNNDLLLNRFGLNLKATPVEDVTVKARMVMYKVWGMETPNAAQDGAFADRFMLMDGTSGHVPQDNTLRVDYAYATVSNIFGAPVWFSIGRRPSTGGIPGNIRENTEKIGTAGIPNIMVDYAFDGFSLGYAPDIEVLPGFYVKLCGGKGFSNGFETNTSANSSLKDTDFLGLNAAIIDTENIHAEIQYQKGMNIFDNPNNVTANLGDIDWAGGVVMGKVGSLNLFFSAAQSMTNPKGTAFFGFDPAGNPINVGMLDGQRRNGFAAYLGGRYDIPSTKTKVGAEYNHGSKYWVGFVPAGDDIWTSKLGARGDVYEVYLIQELNRAAISKNGKAYIRLGYQYYKFDYTGSNNWVGGPTKISDTSSTPQFLPPVENAQDIYLTFDVQF